MSPKDFLESLESIKAVSYELLGETAGRALYFIIVVAILLYLARSLGEGIVRLVDMALLLCVLFGIIITAYGIFTHQNIAGLRLQKGFAVGTIAGAFAALTGGAAYYGIDQAQCCNDEPAVKLFRLLEASVPMGAVFGGIMGLLRPAGERPLRSRRDRLSQDFISFILGFFFLLVLSLSYFYIFDNVGNWSGAEPQGLLRFWQVAVLLVSFVTAYVFLIVFLYDRADERADRTSRTSRAASSGLASLVCAAALFSIPIWAFANADFKERSETTTCTTSIVSSRDQCTDCIDNVYCPEDPRSMNSLEAILLRTLCLIILVFGTYLASTHPRSPILALLDRSRWLRSRSP